MSLQGPQAQGPVCRAWHTGPKAHPMASSTGPSCRSSGPDVVREESHILQEGARVQEQALTSIRDRERKASPNTETESLSPLTTSRPVANVFEVPASFLGGFLFVGCDENSNFS